MKDNQILLKDLNKRRVSLTHAIGYKILWYIINILTLGLPWILGFRFHKVPASTWGMFIVNGQPVYVQNAGSKVLESCDAGYYFLMPYEQIKSNFKIITPGHAVRLNINGAYHTIRPQNDQPLYTVYDEKANIMIEDNNEIMRYITPDQPQAIKAQGARQLTLQTIPGPYILDATKHEEFEDIEHITHTIESTEVGILSVGGQLIEDPTSVAIQVLDVNRTSQTGILDIGKEHCIEVQGKLVLVANTYYVLTHYRKTRIIRVPKPDNYIRFDEKAKIQSSINGGMNIDFDISFSIRVDHPWQLAQTMILAITI